MTRHVWLYYVCVVAVGWTIACQRQEPAPESAFASQLQRTLDSYVPGIRPGQTVRDARGVRPGLHFPLAGPFITDTLRLPNGPFTDVYLDVPGVPLETEPSPNDSVRGVELETNDTAAGTTVRSELTRALGAPSYELCSSSSSGNWRDRVIVWDRGDSGGVSLNLPHTRTGSSTVTVRLVRLYFWAGISGLQSTLEQEWSRQPCAGPSRL